MSSIKLKEDLSNCLINFDRRVLITELLDDYQLSYEEVNTIVQEFLVEQEKKENLKFVKSYLVCGLDEQDQKKKEVYQIVAENQHKDWLKKLQNAESSLYSVEVAGGAKAAAPVFKPMRVVQCEQSKTRQASKTSKVNGEPESAVAKKSIKEEKPKEVIKPQPIKTTPKKDLNAKKTSPKAEISTTQQKVADKKATTKKGIGNFFGPAATPTKKTEDIKPKAAVTKPPTPKKMVDFFKKQTEKPASSINENIKKPDNNTSIQLFDDNEEEPEEVESSDEEEKLEALKRDIISSDVEIEAEEVEQETTTKVKRRRILDSDDEEDDPPVKQEKLEIKEEQKEEETVAETTYLDEDGFVITKKPKQKAAASKTTAAKKPPSVTLKTSTNEKPSSSKETKPATKTTAKTKQARIMNFFSKK